MVDDAMTLAPETRGSPDGARAPDTFPRQFAPLIRDAWYVVAIRREVNRDLKSITVLDTPLVYYRREDGTAVVFDNRCPHRMYPLSKSHLRGDGLQCGYHGFTFDREGRCTFVPGSPHRPNFGLRRYPCVERGAWLWVWMGDEASADPADIPLGVDAYVEENCFDGYVFNPCNYMLVIENLLDLTHLFYMHGPVLADQAYSDWPPEPIDSPGVIGARKTVESSATGILGLWCGDDPQRQIRREEENRAFAPALIDYVATLTPVDRFDEPLNMRTNGFRHALTPKTLYETHQFFWFDMGTPLRVSREEASQTLLNSFFQQDLEAVAYQMDAIMQDRRGDFVERRMVGDRTAMKVHRMLRRRVGAETVPA